MTTEQVLESDAIIWPGEFLAEELEARGMSQRELATKMGRPQQTINEIIRGKKALTAETSVELERILGIPAYLWLRMEARYRLALARRRLQEPAPV
jgi:HTH-type transcriptional regulator/antitoxin HigA